MNIRRVLSKDDTYSTMLLLLSAVKDNPNYTTLSELPYVLDRENFLNFVEFFGGQTLTIPTKKEMMASIRVLLLFQYYKVEKMEWIEAIKKAGYAESESSVARNKLMNFVLYIDSHDCKIGGLLNAIKK